MKIDLYTKIILTLIAVALWGIMLKPILISDAVVAQDNKIIKVNLAKIGGEKVGKNNLNVNINSVGGFHVGFPELPVKIKK